MNLCTNCLEELFDTEHVCPKCNSNDILEKDEFNRIKLEIKSSYGKKKEKILKNTKYSCVNEYLIQKEKRDNTYPELFRNENEVVNPSYSKAKSHINTPTITCPYCQSTDTKKISGTARWLSVGLFGLSSGKVGKQWHCKKCGSDF